MPAPSALEHFAQWMSVCDAAQMNAYSEDFRVKVVDAIERSIPRKEVVRIFGASMPTRNRAGPTKDRYNPSNL
jgi:hypothetical protein